MVIDDIISQCEKGKAAKPQWISRNKLMEIIASQMPRKCENCIDYIVCYQYHTLNRKDCKDWQPDPFDVEKILELVIEKASKK